MKDVQNFNNGDLVLIYRTKDREPAKYRSVITSTCVVEEVLNINSFPNIEEFLNYCEPYSIFTEDELMDFYKTRQYPYIIKMTYNIAFKKRVTNGYLVDKLNIKPNYWGVFKVTDEQFSQIIKAGAVDESIIIN
jgi:hypothetical protein